MMNLMKSGYATKVGKPPLAFMDTGGWDLIYLNINM